MTYKVKAYGSWYEVPYAVYRKYQKSLRKKSK